MISRNLAQRIAFAVVAIPAAVAVLWLGGWVLAGVLTVLGVLGTREVYDLARQRGVRPLDGVGLAAAGVLPLATYWAKGSEVHWAEPALFVGALWVMGVMTLAMWRRGPEGRPLAAVSVTVFGVIYASGLLAFLVAIRHGSPATPARSWAGAWLVLLPLILTWVCDTAAMAAGTAIGGPRLAPVLSPKKTWAGAVAGFAAAVVGGALLAWRVFPGAGVGVSWAQAAIVGAAVGSVGQVGDIAESLYKREAGVKDSSALIPGHGGVLDRLDSLYFVIPAAAGLYKLFGLI